MLAIPWGLIFWMAEMGFLALTGEVAAEIVGVAGGIGFVIGLADDVLLLLVRGSLSIDQVIALQFFLEEVTKIVDETLIYADEDDDSRQARHAALVRWHGQKVYLFGDVHLQDAALLAGSAFYLERTQALESVFGVIANEMTVIL